MADTVEPVNDSYTRDSYKVCYVHMTAIPTKHWVQRRKHQVRDINIYTGLGISSATRINLCISNVTIIVVEIRNEFVNITY